MVWLLAERDGETRGAAYGLVGWHTPPHRAIGAALVAPDERGAGIGIALLDALEGWAGDHGCTELEGPVAEDDDGSLAWAERHGYHEVGRNSRLVLDLTQAEIPEPAPPAGIEIVTWADRPELAPGMWEVAREATVDIPGEEEVDIGTLEEWLARDMQGDERRPTRRVRRGRERRGARLREAVALARDAGARLPRPHRRQARAPRPRDRRRR